MKICMENEKRLIDANALSEKIGNMKFEITNNRGGYKYCHEDEKNEWDKLDSFDSLVCDAPTVDAVEVVHGRWEKSVVAQTDTSTLYMCVKYSAGTLDFTPTCSLELLKEQKAAMGSYLFCLEIRAAIEGVVL